MIGIRLAEESCESQYRSKSQGAILSSNTSVLTQNEAASQRSGGRDSMQSGQALQSLLRAVTAASKTGSKKSIRGSKLG